MVTGEEVKGRKFLMALGLLTNKNKENMKCRILLAIGLLSICSAILSAQTVTEQVEAKRMVIPACKDSVFDKTIDYLHENGYFILNLDKQAGFIQAKIILKNKKLLSAKLSERNTLDFFISPTSNGLSSIFLNINREDYCFSGQEAGYCYHYEDKGVCDDMEKYKSVLDGLKRAIME